MHVEIINNIQDFEKMKTSWDAVYDADPEAQFFVSWVWLSGWLRGAQNWFILSAKQNSDPSSPPVAFFPLRFRMTKTKNGETRKEIAMACNRSADYTGFLCVPRFRNEAIASFAKFLRKLSWDDLHLENLLSSNERTHLLLRNFVSKEFEIKQRKIVNVKGEVDNYICPFVDLPDDWECYLNTLGSNTRAKIRRFLRKIDDSGEFNITHAELSTFEEHINIVLRLWAERWAERKGDNLNGIVNIQRVMLLHCAKNGRLFLPILWQNGAPIGALASLIDPKKRSLLFFIGARDTTVKNPPPAFVLHAHSIRYAIKNGFRTYDFLRGNEPYKYLFGAREREIRYIIVTRRGQQSMPRLPQK